MAVRPALRGDLGRYLAALSGSAGSSGAQFLLTLALLQKLPAEQFAQFAFLWLVAQFIWAVGGSLFAAPLARIASTTSGSGMPEAWQAATWMQLAFALLAMAGSFCLALLVGSDGGAALVFAALVLIGALRLHARVAAYARGGQRAVVIADTMFTLSVLVLTAAAYLSLTSTPRLAYVILVVGNLLGLLPLLSALGLRKRPPDPRRIIMSFGDVWSRYSSWSLLGVIATEVTANAHSYIVTLALGPAAFGPIAASAVLIRPGMVALNALSEFERARMARLLADGRRAAMARARLLFRTVAAILWGGTAVLTWLVLQFAFDRVFPGSYSVPALVTGAWLWVAVLLIRALYLPEAVEMQASGDFAALAWPKIWTAPLSVVTVALLLLLAEPVWSLAGIAVSEAFAALLLLRAHRRSTARGMPA